MSETSATKPIGFIGLGIMGSRMAANLQEQGHDLVVYNRTRKKADQLVAGGASAAASPADVAGQVDVLFTVLSDPQAVEETALGPDGFLDHLDPGALWVDSSTVNPSFSRRMARAAKERHVRFVDAPVAGTKGPAEKGELLFLVGADGPFGSGPVAAQAFQYGMATSASTKSMAVFMNEVFIRKAACGYL